MISYKSSFILANEIPLPWGQNLPGVSPRLLAWGEEGQNIDVCIIGLGDITILP